MRVRRAWRLDFRSRSATCCRKIRWSPSAKRASTTIPRSRPSPRKIAVAWKARLARGHEHALEARSPQRASRCCGANHGTLRRTGSGERACGPRHRESAARCPFVDRAAGRASLERAGAGTIQRGLAPGAEWINRRSPSELRRLARGVPVTARASSIRRRRSRDRSRR